MVKQGKQERVQFYNDIIIFWIMIAIRFDVIKADEHSMIDLCIYSQRYFWLLWNDNRVLQQVTQAAHLLSKVGSYIWRVIIYSIYG